jgi:LytS/YehU family sensor histidine kinase
MVAKLGDLLRLNLDAEATQEIPLEKEMTLVEAYLAIEKVRFQDRLQVEVVIPQDLQKAAVPKFILQPLVENALKHGLAPRARPGRLTLRAAREGEWLDLEVQDNGAGFDSVREGVGLRNTRARLLLLYHENQKLEIFSVPDKGTRIVVRIPLH